MRWSFLYYIPVAAFCGSVTHVMIEDIFRSMILKKKVRSFKTIRLVNAGIVLGAWIGYMRYRIDMPLTHYYLRH